MKTVHVLREGACGRLILDRPEALHALDLPMVRALQDGLAAHLLDPEVQVILLTSSGGKAFCAGGDVRAAVTEGRKDPAAAATFFRQEYQLNYAIATAHKPVVALVDGLCLGGGMGLSVHARHCVVTARASMAMPEMAIGLFPDVGAGVFLNRSSAALGKFLALTGARLSAGDCVAARLAEAVLPDEAQAAFVQALVVGQLETALALCVPRAAETLQKILPEIEITFSADDLAAIRHALLNMGTDWAQAQLALLDAGSPTSQLITLEHLKRSRGQGLAEVLQREFQMASQCLLGTDFFEGVRAQLIDKDRAPRWQKPDPAQISAYFSPPPWPDLSLI